MSTYNKFLIALAAAAGVFSTAASDGALSPEEITQVLIALFGAFLVLLVPNKPKAE